MLQNCAPGLPDSTHTALTPLFRKNTQLGLSGQPSSFFQAPGLECWTQQLQKSQVQGHTHSPAAPDNQTLKFFHF